MGVGRWKVVIRNGVCEWGLRVGFWEWVEQHIAPKQGSTGTKSPSPLALAGVLTLCLNIRIASWVAIAGAVENGHGEAKGCQSGKGAGNWVKQKNQPKKSKDKRREEASR